MRVWPRRGGDAEDAQAGDRDAPLVVSARVLDGEHLSLAVRGGGVALVLHTPSGTTDVAAEPGADRHGPLTTVTLRLEAHAGPDPRGEVTLEVGARSAAGNRSLRLLADRPDPSATAPTVDQPTTPDGRARWHVGDGPGLVLTRRPTAPVVPVVSVRGRDEETEVWLGPGPDGRVEVRHDGGVTAALDLEVAGPGAVRVLPLGRLLAAGPPQEVTGGVLHADGRPLSRTRSHLRRPQRATELPPLPGGLLELRWTPVGHLALRPAGRGGP